ncbi:hypothetical protein F5876DRAFT_91882 [Lentinula aff. lateritia]|uniref:Uncharacterized protein n=1 Tax=Lentinula aff. lateritia TaxID=2804960 RepID=A0ACC1THA1_9AGAR|nr:hypothetical protein F5876DRAFT_91882 [Lentinula aff. lateritia]
MYLKSFLSALLGCEPSQESPTRGILGVIKAHYGCIKAQGRGSLHSLEDPSSDFCTRLIQFLDKTIANSVPHPPQDSIRQKDLHNLVRKCQVHTHTGTCYKYCKHDSQPKECRFGLEASNVEPISYFNLTMGELTLKCLDGLVNNFNEYIIHAIHCNMDIKFIGSGASAKAVLYYITNYITKSQLKAHRAVKRLDNHDTEDDPLTICAKKLIQNQQELSAQQDHFTLHSYCNFYWITIKRFIESQVSLPECVIPKKPRDYFEALGEDVDNNVCNEDNVVGNGHSDETNPDDDEYWVTGRERNRTR